MLSDQVTPTSFRRCIAKARLLACHNTRPFKICCPSNGYSAVASLPQSPLPSPATQREQEQMVDIFYSAAPHRASWHAQCCHLPHYTGVWRKGCSCLLSSPELSIHIFLCNLSIRLLILVHDAVLVSLTSTTCCLSCKLRLRHRMRDSVQLPAPEQKRMAWGCFWPLPRDLHAFASSVTHFRRCFG